MELEWALDTLIYFRIHTRSLCFLIAERRVDFSDHKWVMPKWETLPSAFQLLSRYFMPRRCLDSRNGRRIRHNVAVGLSFYQTSCSRSARNCNWQTLRTRESEMPTYQFAQCYTAGMRLLRGMHWIQSGKLFAMQITRCSPNVFHRRRGWYA